MPSGGSRKNAGRLPQHVPGQRTLFGGAVDPRETEDQYRYATVYKQEPTLYSFSQHAMSNEQWYEQFNTKVDVGSAIGVTRQHQAPSTKY
jgi:hypothetical protein